MLTGGGLLLRHAVERAESPDQFDAVDSDDPSVRKALGQGTQRDAVVRIVERRNQNHVVGDVEIRVACRKPLAVEVERRGHG